MKEQREAMLKEIMKIDFALLDLGLYLDTHPNDTTALKRYNEYLAKSEELRAKYQELYGPLTLRYPTDGNYWKWIEDPWPWNKMEV